MNDIDERDKYLADVLDRSVRRMDPSPDIDRVIVRGNRRRALRRVGMITFVAAFVLVVASAAVVFGRDRPEIPAATGTTTSSPSSPITFRNDARGFEVTYPADWFRADVNLTPELVQPVEILSLATYPIERTNQTLAKDGPVPGMAADVGTDGIFITIQESPGSPRLFTDHRPVSLDPAKTGECPAGTCLGIPTAGEDCPQGYACPDIPGYHAWWIPFRDQGRGFYAFVAMGDGAFSDPARYDLAWHVVDSLRFDPAPAGFVFTICPSLDGALPVGADAAQTAAATALEFVRASKAGDQQALEQVSDPVAAANGIDVGGISDIATSSGAAIDDPIVTGGCGQDVADFTWRVTMDDGTDSASLDLSLYLIRRSDGWKVWGSY